MLFVVQFPIADARPFVDGEHLHLGIPAFPMPRTYGNPEFLRCFGPAAERKLEVDPAWTDESVYCQADKAIRFTALDAQRLGVAPRQVQPSIAFRRFYSDGEAVSRVEIGVSQPRGVSLRSPLTGVQLLKLAQDALNLLTHVRLFREQQKSDRIVTGFGPILPLVQQGRRIGRLYCRATARSWDESVRMQERLVEDGRPMLIIEFMPEEIQELHEAVRRVNVGRLQGPVGFSWLNTPAGGVPVWMIARSFKERAEARRLRLCLLRLHAEREVLSLIIRRLHRRDISYTADTEAGDSLEHYLNKATRNVDRTELYGFQQSAILQAFDAAEDVGTSGDRENLADMFERVRRQVWEKVIRFEDSRGDHRNVESIIVNNTPGGNVTVARSITRMSNDYDVHDIHNSQIGAIGSRAHGKVSGDINVEAAQNLDVGQLLESLMLLQESLGATNMPRGVRIAAQTATGQAIAEVNENEKIDSQRLIDHVKQVGDSLKETNTTIEEGTTLWESVQRLATVIGPIVGGAHVIAQFFGLP